MADEVKYTVKLNGKDKEFTEKEILEKIHIYENKVQDELKKINTDFTKKPTNLAVYLNHLDKRLPFLEWMNNKFSIQQKSSNVQIYQRQIFYCQLGYNIGSEQNNRRPVVVIQNDLGNIGNTTIIAPITTHNGEIKQDGDKYYIMVVDNSGTSKRKYLGYYEVPIVLETIYTQEIKGFINIAHLIEVDKKRFDTVPVAKITRDNFSNAIVAINKNFRMTT